MPPIYHAHPLTSNPPDHLILSRQLKSAVTSDGASTFSNTMTLHEKQQKTFSEKVKGIEKEPLQLNWFDKTEDASRQNREGKPLLNGEIMRDVFGTSGKS